MVSSTTLVLKSSPSLSVVTLEFVDDSIDGWFVVDLTSDCDSSNCVDCGTFVGSVLIDWLSSALDVLVSSELHHLNND